MSQQGSNATPIRQAEALGIDSSRIRGPSNTESATPMTGLSATALRTQLANDATELRKPILREPHLDPHLGSPNVFANGKGNSAPLTFASSAISPNSLAMTANDSSKDQVTEEVMDKDGVKTEGMEDEYDENHVSAYARLDFESFTFYVQTLQVLLGRRAENDQSMVDVHLGPSKAISRRHAKIFYNFATQRFEITVIGRNGLFVGDAFVETGATVPLYDGTRVQIGQITFTFVLPSVPKGEDSSGMSTPQSETADADSTVTQDMNELSSRSRPSSSQRKPKHSLSLNDGDENNLFAVKAAEQARSVVPPASRRKPKREYKPEEIPLEHRTKPTHSYSHLIATALRNRDGTNGTSLSDIYDAIMEHFPYYKYCPSGWQNSVRHNLSSSKAFYKVSKEGKGWLWGLNEEYFAERELQKQKAAAKQARVLAEEKAQEELRRKQSQEPNGQVSTSQPAGASGVNPAGSTNTGLDQTTIKLLATLQQRLTDQLAKAGAPQINRQLLTNSLAVVIAQAARASGGINNLGHMLQDPANIQKLLVQALEVMKKQSQNQNQNQNRNTVPASSAPAVSGLPAPAIQPPTQTPITAENGSTQGSNLAHSPTTKETLTPILSGESPVLSVPSRPSGDQSTQPATQAPAVVKEEPQSTAVGISPDPPSLNSAMAPSPISTSDSTVAVAQTSSNPPPTASQPVSAQQPQAPTLKSVPAQQPGEASVASASQASPPGAPQAVSPPVARPTAPSAPSKPPLTLEKINELISQAEKIPNPTPAIKAALDQLRTHKANMLRKRSAEDDAQNSPKRAHIV